MHGDRWRDQMQEVECRKNQGWNRVKEQKERRSDEQRQEENVKLERQQLRRQEQWVRERRSRGMCRPGQRFLRREDGQDGQRVAGGRKRE